MANNHTFGAKCRLAPVKRVQKEDGMPPVDAQFFYSSIIPIDDPLSTGSVTGTTDTTKSNKSLLRPFGRGDNNALEKAWLGLMSNDDRNDHEAVKHNKAEDASKQAHADKLAAMVQTLALKHWEKHHAGCQPQDTSAPLEATSIAVAYSVCCSELVMDVSEQLHQKFCAVVRRQNAMFDVDEVVQQVMTILNQLRLEAGTPKDSQAPMVEALDSEYASPRNTAPNLSVRTPKSGADDAQPLGLRQASMTAEDTSRTLSTSLFTNKTSSTPGGGSAPARPSGLDDGISGKPFVRVGSPGTPLGSSPGSFPRPNDIAVRKAAQEEVHGAVSIQQDRPARIATKKEHTKLEDVDKRIAEVAVGISRLHMVALPLLQMKPIYWSPVNDVAIVMRATWFYRDTMLPVPPPVANQLEDGYGEMKPWTETWSDELRCAIDVGPLGEEKVSYQLWPKEADVGYGDDRPWEPPISSDPYCAARCFQGEAAAEGSLELAPPGPKLTTECRPRAFSNYHVIYKNKNEAFLLKPNLKPSAYYGRRPVMKIMKGITVGIPVVRGFNRQKWESIHQKKQTPNKPGQSAANESHESSGQGVCPACKEVKEQGQVTDLVLVAHGIGQKFAERVESFHFTHAINGFRRAMNVELGSPIVQQMLREGQNGMMILPLNWRMGLSFEDGGPMRDEDKNEYTPEGFGLKDIEPDTIPAIRSMISDVMFDIPFYMSHHKGKMIKALVSEANRVYRLWCRNNPGFADNGRVHMIAHSLGSAMALEILSRQPTSVPRINLTVDEPETQFFEFDTKNLFLVGSPAGFFLLLEKGILLPRRGRLKTGADPNDTVAKGVVGEEGTFGCLAVDNIYNVLAKEDPIAYLLNGAVDPNYASTLKVAYVPSTATSLFKSVGDAVRQVVPGMAPPQNLLFPEPERPSTIRLPSQLELEVHDFSREEIAERKAFLLNDNGQIDWYLRSGGGPLEIQYLNMLSAHTSYWTNHDFIRMLCMEIGRKPGRAHTLPAMRAVKATKRLLVS